MKLYEADGKTLFRNVGIPVPEGRIATTPQEAKEAAVALGSPCVIKAQVLTGGRGKRGAVRFADNPQEAEQIAEEILGNTVLGLSVKKVLVEKKAHIEKELYLSLVIDSKAGCAVVMLGSEGGMDIEELAKARPDSLVKIPLRIGEGLYPYQVRNALCKLGLPMSLGPALTGVGQGLVRLLDNYASTLAEINPLAVTNQNEVLALDAKVVIDDNWIDQSAEILAIVEREPDVYFQENIKVKYGFDFVDLERDGAVGLITTGAGLSMAVVDLVKNYGMAPINFVDIRTNGLRGDPTRLVIALERILTAPNLRVIFINIFAGITDLVEFSTTLLKALATFKPLKVDIVVRLNGYNVDKARKILGDAGIEVLTSLDEALQLVVEKGEK